MTNYEYIKSLPIEEFAKLLIIDNFFTKNFCDAFEISYIAPNGESFYFYDDAIDETIGWLKNKKVNNSFLETYLCLRKN